MRASHFLLLLRFAALIAWGTSIALTIDYLSPVPAFCSGASGCGAVRDSGLGYFDVPGLGVIPLLPLLGAAAFSLLFWLTLLPGGARRRRFAAPLAFSVLPVGLLLLAAQAAIGAFCSLCVVVDVAALVAGAMAWLLRGNGWEAATSEDDNPSDDRSLILHGFSWGLLGFVAILGPVLYPALVAINPTPPAITSLYRPGKINVVEFFDFGCPHCRALTPRLDALLAPYGDRVHFVRRHVPLDFHPGAREASRLALCAEEQGRGEVVAHAFLSDETAPTLELGALKKLALGLGVQAAPLDTCLASKRPDLRLAEDRARLEQAGFEGLPTTYIGGLRVLGAGPDELYLDALGKVASGRDLRGLVPGVYWGLIAIVVAILVVLGRKRPVR